MSTAIFALDIIFTFFITAWLLNKFGNPRKSYAVTISVLIAWFFSFSIVLILPLDVSAVRTILFCAEIIRRGILIVLAAGTAASLVSMTRRLCRGVETLNTIKLQRLPRQMPAHNPLL
jgi:hypothetical protein